MAYLHEKLWAVAAVVSLVGLSGCGSDSTPSPGAAASPETVTQMIGAEGGTIAVGGATVTFPKDALSAPKSITISTTDAAPSGFVVLSHVFKCEPSGTEFAQPVTMQMPFTDDGKGGTLFWSEGADPTFKDLGGVTSGKTVTATVKHFSSGFVGRKL